MTTVVFGAGGFAREVLGMITGDVVFYVDPSYGSTNVCPSKTTIISDLRKGYACEYIIGVADPILKRKFKEVAERHGLIASKPLISPKAIIGDRVTVGKGSIICAGSIITCDIQIGEFVTINLNCTVGHDATIKSFSSVMPGCHISGNCEIGENVFVGTNTAIREKTKIADGVTIGMCSNVIKDISQSGVYAGNPCKELRK